MRNGLRVALGVAGLALWRMGARINVAPSVREYLAQVGNNSKKLVLTIPTSPGQP